jgi:hypothetical protein
VTAQVVDNPAALEFFEQVLAAVSRDELAEIAGDLRAKSAAMRALVGDDPAGLDDAGVRDLLGWVFCTRRHVDKVMAFLTPEEFAGGLADLLHGEDPLAQRFDRFRDLFGHRPDVAADLPGELLHFLDPERYWLWTRWIWDPEADTGALRLVTTDEVDLDAPTPGEGYYAVGEAMAMLEENGKAVGYTTMGTGLFGTDVFLASVYATYMYTVLQMRLSREFTKVMPPLPGLVRRLLGVHVIPARRS